MAFGQASVLALLAGILLQDLAIQGVHVTNTSCIYPLRPEAQPPDGRLHDQLFHWRRVRLAGIVLALFAFRLDRRGGRRGGAGRDHAGLRDPVPSARVPETALSPIRA